MESLTIGQYTPTHRGWISQRTAHTLRTDALWAQRVGYRVFDLSQVMKPGSSIEVNRNQAVQRAYNEGCNWLQMLDDDVSLPWGQSLLEPLARSLLAHGAVAAAAVVPVNGGREGKVNVFPVRAEPEFEAQFVSAAAVLIDLRRLLEIPWPPKTPFFSREFNAAMTQCTLDEGYFFSRHVRAAGGKLVACCVHAQHDSPSGR